VKLKTAPFPPCPRPPPTTGSILARVFQQPKSRKNPTHPTKKKKHPTHHTQS
jgi:hypothetical protein